MKHQENAIDAYEDIARAVQALLGIAELIAERTPKVATSIQIMVSQIDESLGVLRSIDAEDGRP